MTERTSNRTTRMTFVYQKAVDTLKSEIASGRWKPGDAFPGVREIRARFRVSHLTAVKVLDGLKSLRLVESRRGAGTFVAQTHRLFGFLSPSFGLAPFFPLIRREVGELCQRNAISFEVREIDRAERADYAARLEAAARALVAHGISGLVYVPSANVASVRDCDSPPPDLDHRILALFDAARIPVVLVDSGLDSPLEDRYDLVGIDNRAVGVKLGRHLVEQGVRRILFVSWRCRLPNVRDRLAGLREVADAARAELSSAVLTKAGVREFKRTVKSPDRPDAIGCSSDCVASMVLDILRQVRVRVPEDVLLAGVDDIAPARSTGLTTVRQPSREIARAVCETLLGRIARPKSPPRHVMVATTLLPRASTMHRGS